MGYYLIHYPRALTALLPFAPLQGLHGADGFPEHGYFLRLGRAHYLPQGIEKGIQAELEFGMSEDSRLRCDDKIADRGQIETATQNDPADGGDHWFLIRSRDSANPEGPGFLPAISP